jgi:hypothetical protein
LPKRGNFAVDYDLRLPKQCHPERSTAQFKDLLLRLVTELRLKNALLLAWSAA